MFTIIYIGILHKDSPIRYDSFYYLDMGAVYLAPVFELNIPSTVALFSAFLGYNPLDSILACFTCHQL
jgi:hypothetical protein